MHSSGASVKQAHSPTAAGERCAMHSCVGTLQWAGTCPPQKCFIRGKSRPHLTYGFLDPHTDTQTTSHATPVGIGCALDSSSRQFFSARNYTVPYRIVSMHYVPAMQPNNGK